MTTKQIKSGVLNAIFAIPLLGWMIRDAVYGRDSAMGFFAANYALIALVSALIWGLPAVVVCALVAAVGMGVLLILITQG